MTRTSKADRDAVFAAFMSEATPSLMRTAYLLTGSTDTAAELVQATLVKAYAAWPSIRPETALAYTRRILVNQRTDGWRRTRHEVAVADVPDRPRPEDGTELLRHDVVRLLRTLPEQQRKVVVLRYYQDLSEASTAEMLGISVGAVKSAASRGLAALRALPATTEGGIR